MTLSRQRGDQAETIQCKTLRPLTDDQAVFLLTLAWLWKWLENLLLPYHPRSQLQYKKG